MRPALALMSRELRLASAGANPVLGVGFLTAVTVMVPFALGQGPATLKDAAPAVVWIALILASLLGLDRLFERDLDSGALDQLALGPLPLSVVAAIKGLAQWTTCGAPVALAAPIAALSLGAPARSAPAMLVAGLLGALASAALGSVGAALTLASRRAGVLIALVVLPLLTPPVIFGGAAIAQASAGRDWSASLALLAGYTLFAAVLSPFAAAAACRNALD